LFFMFDVIVQRLSAEVVKIMAALDIDDKARAQGFRVDARPYDKFAPFLDDEIQRWGRIIRTAHITAD